ncbi:helix-turn-helix domain-containing protein [Nocardia takedensis]
MGASSTLPRRLLGRELYRLREAAGVTMEEAKASISVGKQTIWRMETGQPVRLRLIDVERLCQTYGADQRKTAALLKLAEAAQGNGEWHAFDEAFPERFDPFAALEQEAHRLMSYQSLLIPGLLQTREYRREVIWTELPHADTAEIESRIEDFERRKQRLVDRDDPVELTVVVDEAQLRRPIGGPRIMAAQLRHLAEVGELPNVSIRVLPATTGMHLGLISNAFVLMEFPRHPRPYLTEPPITFVQCYTGGLYLEQHAAVTLYRRAYTRLHHMALDEPATRTLLTAIAEELATLPDPPRPRHHPDLDLYDPLPDFGPTALDPE